MAWTSQPADADLIAYTFQVQNIPAGQPDNRFLLSDDRGAARRGHVGNGVSLTRCIR